MVISTRFADVRSRTTGRGRAYVRPLLPVVDLPLLTSLYAKRGPQPTFSRALEAGVQDWEGKVRWCRAGEARFWGFRRVENVVAGHSEDWTNVAWTKSASMTATARTLTAADVNQTVLQTYTAISQSWRLRVRMSRISGTGNIDLTIDGGATWTTVTLTADPQVFSIAQSTVTNPQFGIRITTSGDSINADEIQLESTAGQANTNPSEYVSVGVLNSSTEIFYHGTGVDGTKCFKYQNGNTVAANVVTEAIGTTIVNNTSAVVGYYRELALTNIALWSQDHSNAVWVPTSMTVAADNAEAPDGTMTATLLTATGANGQILQDLGVLGSVSRNYRVWLKRKTGTGTVQLRLNSAATWTTVTITTSWAQYLITVTGTNPDVGIRMATSGNELWCWGSLVYENNAAVVSNTAYAQSVRTTTVSVLKPKDALTGVIAENVSNDGTAYAEAYVGLSGGPVLNVAGGGANMPVLTIDDGSGNNYVEVYQSSGVPTNGAKVRSGNVAQADCQNSSGGTIGMFRCGAQWRLNSVQGIGGSTSFGVGWIVVPDVTATMPVGLNAYMIGEQRSQVAGAMGVIRRVKIFGYRLRTAIGGGGALWDLHRSRLLEMS